MSHEIRTPLNAISGMAYLVRRAGLTPEQHRRIRILEASSAHLLSMLDGVLELSRIEAGKFSLDKTSFRVSELLANVRTLTEEQVRSKGLTLTVEPAAHLPGSCMGDRTRIQQALLNYVSNAIKFTPAGTVTLRVQVATENPTQVRLRFAVQDTGIGIAPDLLPRLFDAFERADNSLTRQYGGSGLGLAITRKIVEQMDGRVGAESTPGVGSTFWFEVPLDKGEATDAAPPPVENAEEAIRNQFPGKSILMAEDEPVNREITRMLLTDAGLATDLAADGVAALELAADRAYDLILLDLQMPRLNGLETAERLRRLPAHANTPILALTANVFQEDRDRCLAAGMNDFIAKPIDPPLLFRQVLAWLRRSGAQPR